MRLDELTERTLEHGRTEPVEGVADPLQQSQVLAELVDGRERTHVGLGDQLVAALEERRHARGVQTACQLVGGAGSLGAGEGHAVPGRVVRAEAELAEARGLGEGLGFLSLSKGLSDAELETMTRQVVPRRAVVDGGTGSEARRVS